MAATNKLHSTIHHRMAAILAHTVLEWTLICLLLLNSVFSYLLSKFASFFGLHPPCLLCNRIDHLFEPGRSHLDMLCHDHCRLLEADRTCGDCRVGVDIGFLKPSLGIVHKGDLVEEGFECKDGVLGRKGDVGGLAFDRQQEGDEAAVADNDSIEVVTQCSKSCSESLKLVDVVEDESYVPLVKESTINCLADCPSDIPPRSVEVIHRRISDVELEILQAAGNSDETRAFEDESKTMDSEADCEVSIGSEIGDPEDIDHPRFHDPASMPQHWKCYDETTDSNLVFESEPVELVLRGADNLSICAGLNEAEQDQAPESPMSIEKNHAMRKRFFFERSESGTESMDGCIASEFEGGEPLTMKRLKSALKAEHNALSALYAELEEERSASAIAANQTMAMITRLQEEKAAVQMEASQYQRMMEQQSEYDQEALQLLNELATKREKENQELEKELELYRKKVLLLEAKERRMRIKGSDRSGTSSPSSTAEDSDDHSFDFHEGDECFNSLDESNQNAHTDSTVSSGAAQETASHLITLDEALTVFEKERLSILEQLKALEEKLFAMDGEEPSSNLEDMEHFSKENGLMLNGQCEDLGKYENGFVNCFSDAVDVHAGLHLDQISMGYRAKRLFPLFDTISFENEDELYTKHDEFNASPKAVSKFTLDQKKLAIEEEVNNVYERLQALEADRDFFKHSVSSLKKGNKGMHLLQEILQHLRDLRNVEIRMRNGGNAIASFQPNRN